MIFPTLTITGVEDVVDELDRRIELMKTGVVRVLTEGGEQMRDEMVLTHTFQNRTYRLEGSIGYRINLFEAGILAQLLVFAAAPYADLVEFGHPGARPYPFFYPVWYKNTPELEQRLHDVVIAALEAGELA